MASFLLVHGSCHGAWCWRDLIPALEAFGHSIKAIDMPSHGADPTPVAEVTLDSCRDAVLHASTADTIIVGHSWGGYPISAAAEAQPNAMRALIYLCAYVPKNGLAMAEMRRLGPRQTIAHAVEKSPDGMSYTVSAEAIPQLFYHDCPDGILPYAYARLCPQAIRPQETPLPTGANFDSVPKAYLRTTDDRTIPTEYQAEMSDPIPEDLRRTINSSHSPFFSHPRELAKMLSELADRLP